MMSRRIVFSFLSMVGIFIWMLIPGDAVSADKKCDVIAIEKWVEGDSLYVLKTEAEFRQYQNYGVVNVGSLKDLKEKLQQYSYQNSCDCIRNLMIAGYGDSAFLSVGRGEKGNSPNQDNYIAPWNKDKWDPQLGDISALLCDTSSQVWLIGSHIGHCYGAPDFLYSLANTLQARVKAPVDEIYGGKIVDYMTNGNWQEATPTSKPDHKSNPEWKAAEKEGKAEDQYFCPCNNSTYSHIQDCTNECSTSLSCFTNICDKYRSNNFWEIYAANPIMTAGSAGTWDESGVSSPSVLRKSPYAMWYTGWSSSSYESIGYATSDVGFDWTKHPNNPVLTSGESGSWDDYGVYNPHVIKDQDTYKMWYTGYSSTDQVFQIGYATSPDGINWTKDTNNPVLRAGASGAWDADGVGAPTVIKDSTTYKMWYEGSDVDRWLRIGYATSPDGINWTKDPNNPVMSEGDWDAYNEWGVAAPSVVKDGNIYHMLFIGIDANNLYNIGHAYSADGTNWTESPDNPHFSRSYGDRWDSGDVGHPTLFKDENESAFKVFYRGQDESTWSIGYAVTASLEGAVSTSTTTTIDSTTSTTTITTESTTTTTIEDQACPAELIYGEDSEQTQLLRYFRDNVLNQSPEGQELIKLYYKWSPAIVKAMVEDERLKEDVEEMINGLLILFEGEE